MKSLICLLPMMALTMGAAVPEVAEEGNQNLLTAANNAFSSKMFNEIAKKNEGKSVIMSGFSALSPLAQLALASVGESHDEILKTIGLPNDEVTKEAFTATNKNLRSVKGLELKVANSVFIPENAELNEGFAKLSRDVFSSDVKKVNFGQSQKAAAVINGWVEDNTNKRIKDLVSPDSLDESTRAVLVNAIYFKGKWGEQFDKQLTQDRDFHVNKEKTVKVPTMFKNGNFKYAESSELNAKLLELPYEGDEASLLIVLPNEVDGINELQKKLSDPAALARASAQMFEVEVDVFLPKFKIETTIDLKEVLQKIGINKLFIPGAAQLDNIIKSESDLYVSNAIQKAFIEVNEEGTEAAAASAYGTDRIFGGSAPPFIANRPFYFELLKHGSDKDTAVFTGFLRSI